MSAGALAAGWVDSTSIGYPALFAGVLLGSIVPVVPTGAVVGVAAAFAMTTDTLGLVQVLAVATVAALIGDLVTFSICRFGGPTAVRWVSRGQHPERVDEVREQFRRHGWQIIVAGRLLPAGRIPVLLAAGALSYPWRRLVPAALAATFLWACAYAVLGVTSGGIFDSPLLAALIAALLVLAVTGMVTLISSRRRRPAPVPVPVAEEDPPGDPAPISPACEPR
jgi:membrane protein DedA with SNARE-associated domain